MPASLPGSDVLNGAFDVVIVPDFDGPRAYDFVLRTLFFLASWLENAGRAREFPLHVACIGEPPPSVQWLAERCRARISIHPPLLLLEKRYSNKIRGLEVQPVEDRLLLLDVDTLILSDIADLGDLGKCIAAAPAFQPQVPQQDWVKIFDSLGIPQPAERMDSIRGELDLPPILRPLYRRQHAERNQMFPYYNSGVLFLPWDSGIRPVWEDRIVKAASLFNRSDDAWFAVGQGDQVGLSLATQHLRSSGLPFRRLPPEYHGQWMYLYRGTPKLAETKIYHATRFLVAVEPGPEDVPREIVRYRDALLRRFARECAMEAIFRLPRPSLFRRGIGGVRNVRRVAERLWRLHRDHVAPALKKGRHRTAAPSHA
jgi:hypothetical protein